ncbi:fumA [Symbiodinium sp. CCMP2592]|nr:fumA [Symbiodinium sp. CCMP2592]
MSLQSACCGDHRSTGPLVEVVTPLDLPGVLESINDGLGTVLHLLQQNCSDQLQLKNLAIVHQEMMLRQERCMQNLAEGLAISAPCTSMQKKDRDEENEDHDKVESVVHFQLDEVSDGAEGWMAPNQQVRSCTSSKSRSALAIPHGDRECPADEILLPVIQKGSSPTAKKMSSRDGPKFGQRFVTQGQESEPETVAFEIIGLASHGSPRRTLASSAREMASSTALRRFFFHWVASAIEWCEDCREPHRTGILAKIVKSNRFGGLCMTVILLNSIVISYQSDFEMKNPGATTPYPLMMIELGFAFFYGIEILLKLAVHRFYFFINDDMRWNLFDLGLVCLSLVEVTSSFVLLSKGVSREGINLTFLRLLRLCKIAKVLRVLRTLRFFRELRLMLDCVLGSVINAIWCVAMLFFVMFIFALLMVQGLADYLGQYSREFGPESLTEEFVGDIMLWYGSVGRTILTLFQSTTSGIDWRDCYLPLEQSSELVAGMFLVFVGLFTISVWNIVTSTFVEKALKLAQPDLESLVMEHHLKDVQDAQSLIDLFCSRLGCSETSSICHGQFKLLAGQHRFRAYLTARGIDIKNVEVFFRMLAAASGNAEVEIKVLANALVRMKGFATSIDLQTLTFETKMQLSKQARSVKEVGRHVRRIEKLLENGTKCSVAQIRSSAALSTGAVFQLEKYGARASPAGDMAGQVGTCFGVPKTEVMPSCQDTGTAAMVKRGTHVLTDGRDEEFISRGIYKAYTEGYLRYSQVAPLSMFEEANTKTNLPAQIDMLSQHGSSYDVFYIAKGGGSANKTQLLQKTKGVLNDKAFTEFVTEQVQNIGTAACPPYHLALVVGGLSAEQNLKTVKLASCKYLDGLPTSGNKLGRAFRDLEWEEKVKKLAQDLGIGAQFGGKYFLHDVRIVRLPRHGASCPIGIGVSCSADRQAKAKITEEGVFLEQLETDPAKYLPDVKEQSLDKGGEIVKVDLNKPMEENLKILSNYPVATRLALTGTIIVARDIAHAKMQEMLDSGKGLPEYIKKYPVYYAGPAKTPAGMPSGSFGPTTSGRMDQYVGTFQAQGGSMIMIGKGNRSKAVTNACKEHGGFYLGSIGGVAATLSSNSIKKVEVLDMEELGMEASQSSFTNFCSCLSFSYDGPWLLDLDACCRAQRLLGSI